MGGVDGCDSLFFASLVFSPYNNFARERIHWWPSWWSVIYGGDQNHILKDTRLEPEQRQRTINMLVMDSLSFSRKEGHIVKEMIEDPSKQNLCFQIRNIKGFKPY